MAQTDESDDGNEGEQVKSVSTLFSILELLKENNRMGVTALADELGMSKGAIHRYLRTLVDKRYAINKDGEYELGMRFLDLGTYVRERYPYRNHIEPKVRQLADQSGERAQYIVEEHGMGIYLYRKRGENAVQTDARVGKIVHLHTTAAGKAILSQQSHERNVEILGARGLVQSTHQTITDRKKLFEELEEIQDQGYALNKEEHVSGLYAIGVPIADPEGQILGGLSVSGPKNRLKKKIDTGAIQQTLLGIQNEIELNLTYS